ncbi:hypothetical protein HTZ77_32800 [Nonomuraea sp. SMC257]|uniref:Uncharacterized protein n=1 Tax=Nonomuraea montanisoli TaxID=2741721 RepID=A0A7Y6IEI3_9ACTN|nr:hypothetical protein [Nonomuraea montanisoli]NUW36158.1 hypothetical protein [Nonomuraea montanisoli]
MIRIDAVLETGATVGFTAWPVAEPAGDGILALSGRMSPAEVGTAMAVIFGYGDIPTTPTGELHQLLDRHLADAETLLAPGGLRVRDTATGARILPGCCCGLENWREWRDVPHEKGIWLGHDPHTEVEHVAGAVRLRQGAGPPSLPSSQHEVEIRLDDLPDLLTTVQRRLQGFLGLVRPWASEISPRAADRLVAVLDESFEINGSLAFG